MFRVIPDAMMAPEGHHGAMKTTRLMAILSIVLTMGLVGMDTAQGSSAGSTKGGTSALHSR
jgi:hypothetical protein